MSIKIFDSKPNSNRRMKRGKSHRKNLVKAGEERLSKIDPMAFGILAVKAQETPDNDFIRSSLKAISESPERLTDKWVVSINKFVDSVTKACLLDPPDYNLGQRVSFESLAISRVIPAKHEAEYPMPAIMCVDNRGWKFYFKTSKAYDYKGGDIISFTATVSSHKEGITFLRRPSRLNKINLDSETKEVEDDK